MWSQHVVFKHYYICLVVFDSERTSSYSFGAQLVYKRFKTKTAQNSLYRGDVFPEPSNELMTNCLSTTAQEKDFTDSYMPFVKDKWSVKNH